ncbi:hypothetical protein COCMIDRAFT_87403, partial [Bipolaris oryzae ATCC 44560]
IPTSAPHAASYRRRGFCIASSHPTQRLTAHQALGCALVDTPCMALPSLRQGYIYTYIYIPCSRRAACPSAHLAAWPSFAAGACSAWMPLRATHLHL